MTESRAVVQQRLANHRIARAGARDPAGIVEWLGAVQAQEFGPAKWGIGLRLGPGATDAQVQRAVDAGRILRTHVLRPTWHFVTPRDIRWMLELTAPSVRRRMATYWRRMRLDASTFIRAAKICERILRDGQFLTRAELGAHFARAGLPHAGYLLAHLALYAELEGVICSGPRRAKQSTYGLLEERAPTSVRLSRDEALGELARRYFRSHGPATVRDFVWWSGLSTPDAKRSLEINRVAKLDADGTTYWSLGRPAAARFRRPFVRLLPIYDEYIVAYRDRAAVPQGPSLVRSRAGGYVQFQHALVIDGQVAGTWRVTAGSPRAEVTVAPLRTLTLAERRAVQGEILRYQRFLMNRRDR